MIVSRNNQQTQEQGETPLVLYPPNHKKAEKYVESVEYGMASCRFPAGLASAECPDVDPGCVSVCVSLIHLLSRPVAVCLSACSILKTIVMMLWMVVMTMRTIMMVKI